MASSSAYKEVYMALLQPRLAIAAPTYETLRWLPIPQCIEHESLTLKQNFLVVTGPFSLRSLCISTSFIPGQRSL